MRVVNLLVDDYPYDGMNFEGDLYIVFPRGEDFHERRKNVLNFHDC